MKSILPKLIRKYDGENSMLVYYSIIEFNRITDSLVYVLKSIGENKQSKKEIIRKLKFSKFELKHKLNSIKEFNTQYRIDSLLKDSEDLEFLPNFALETEILSEKLNATKGAELILNKLNEKTMDEKNRIN